VINKIENWSKGAPTEDGLYVLRSKEGWVHLAERMTSHHLQKGTQVYYSLAGTESKNLFNIEGDIAEHAKLEVQE